MSVRVERGLSPEGHVAFFPKNYAFDGTVRGVLVWVGHANSALDALNPVNWGTVCQDIADQTGRPVLAMDRGGTQLWSNDTSTAAANNSRVNWGESWLRAKPNEWAVLGGSMGAAQALEFARRYPTKVSSVALLIPAIDYAYITANGGGLATSLNAAFGGVPANVKNHAHASNAASIAGLNIPIKCWYSDTDTTVGDSRGASGTSIVFANGVNAVRPGVVQTQSMGSIGHAINSVGFAGVLSWFASTINGTLGTGPDTPPGGGAPLGTIFGQDAFTDTDAVLLQAHAATTGGPWVKHAGATVDAAILANRLRTLDAADFSTEDSVYYITAAPATADYDVQVDVVKLGTSNGEVRVNGRQATTAPLTMYSVQLTTAGAMKLYKANAGTYTQLGSNYTATFSASDTLILRLRGSSISVLWNGATVIGPVSDTAITTAGVAGVQLRNIMTAGNGLFIDNFVATNA